jgi:hypothetical protein
MDRSIGDARPLICKVLAKRLAKILGKLPANQPTKRGHWVHRCLRENGIAILNRKILSVIPEDELGGGSLLLEREGCNRGRLRIVAPNPLAAYTSSRRSSSSVHFLNYVRGNCTA